jgi:hypothetical protein
MTSTGAGRVEIFGAEAARASGGFAWMAERERRGDRGEDQHQGDELLRHVHAATPANCQSEINGSMRQSAVNEMHISQQDLAYKRKSATW